MTSFYQPDEYINCKFYELTFIPVIGHLPFYFTYYEIQL